MHRFLILVILCFAAFIGLKAQELRQGYLDSVKGFFRSKSLIDWIQKAEFKNRIIHPAILIHPTDSTITEESSKNLFENNKYSKIYHWEARVSKITKDTFFYKNDSLILTKQEKKEIVNIFLNSQAAQFNWSTEYFPGASFINPT
jgi:hypothetical protein